MRRGSGKSEVSDAIAAMRDQPHVEDGEGTVGRRQRRMGEEMRESPTQQKQALNSQHPASSEAG